MKNLQVKIDGETIFNTVLDDEEYRIKTNAIRIALGQNYAVQPEETKSLRIELVWNRETNWAFYKEKEWTLTEAIASAKDIRDSGDGARVKKIRVIDNANDKTLWNG